MAINHPHLEVEFILCSAAKGSNLRLCASDAAMMALDENRIVKFNHNDTLYVADPDIFRDYVIENTEQIDVPFT